MHFIIFLLFVISHIGLIDPVLGLKIATITGQLLIRLAFTNIFFLPDNRMEDWFYIPLTTGYVIKVIFGFVEIQMMVLKAAFSATETSIN